MFWTKENSHFTIELVNNPPHVMLWAGATAGHLPGLYFFARPVNAATSLKM
jgi:hypothetical protein